jgi:arylsulfatase A-like enzyme
MADQPPSNDRRNILFVTVDQYRYPRFSYGPEHGLAEPLKRILGFHEDIGKDNPYAKFFPGLLRLRENAIVLRNHTVASNACTPSRATIYTGQYGTRTGVTQTDGLFKNGDTPNFPWLAPDGIPTLGNWMREAGYATHYFGKWHVSNPPDQSLERYGFDNWEDSYPEPHGAAINNLGVYRDGGFADLVVNFLRRQGLALNYDRAVSQSQRRNPTGSAPTAQDVKPWFAVVSFANPHDIATYPAVIGQALPAMPDGSQVAPAGPQGAPQTQSMFGPLKVPLEGQVAIMPTAGTIQIPLNPLGFPQDCAHLPPTWNEDLLDKPGCQFDAVYKVGLGLAAKTGLAVAQGIAGAVAAATGATPNDDPIRAALLATLKSSIPFPLADDPAKVCRDFIQFYGYLHSVVDEQIERVLRALEESGQADNTIVVFLSDHGELAAAHGMGMEKWHCAYQEAVHVPVVVKLPENVKDNAPVRSIEALTSHIDLLPTVLGLAEVDAEAREKIRRELAEQRPTPPLPGSDLSPLLKGKSDIVTEPDGKPRQGVLFITDDEISEPLAPSATAYYQASLQQYEVFEIAVRSVRQGLNGKGPVERLAPGPIRQPNHIRAVRTPDYKLARYFDPSGKATQEWEMYDMRNDPNETTNLVELATTPPKARSHLPHRVKVQHAADELAKLLAELELRDL